MNSTEGEHSRCQGDDVCAAWEQLSEFRSGSFLALTSTHWGRWAPQRLWRREGAAGRRRGGGCGCGGKRGFTLVFTLGVGPPNPSPQPRGTYLRPSETPWRCTLTTWLTITQSYPHKNTYTHTHYTPDEGLCTSEMLSGPNWKWRDMEWPFLTLSHSLLGISANRRGQTAISNLNVW